MGLFIEMQLIFAEVSFRVRYGASYVRSLRKIGVNLYRRRRHPHNLHGLGRASGGWICAAHTYPAQHITNGG